MKLSDDYDEDKKSFLSYDGKDEEEGDYVSPQENYSLRGEDKKLYLGEDEEN